MAILTNYKPILQLHGHVPTFLLHVSWRKFESIPINFFECCGYYTVTSMFKVFVVGTGPWALIRKWKINFRHNSGRFIILVHV